MRDVQDVGYPELGTFMMGYVWDTRFLGYEMLGDVACLLFGVLGVGEIGDVRCLRCGVLRMWDAWYPEFLMWIFFQKLYF